MKKFVTAATVSVGVGLAALSGAGVASASGGGDSNNSTCCNTPQTVRTQTVRVAVKQINRTNNTTANTIGRNAVGGVVQTNGSVTVTVSQ